MVSGVRAAYPGGTVAEGICDSFAKRDRSGTRRMLLGPFSSEYALPTMKAVVFFESL
jgi:hypothetical protein